MWKFVKYIRRILRQVNVFGCAERLFGNVVNGMRALSTMTAAEMDTEHRMLRLMVKRGGGGHTKRKVLCLHSS
jgi:hypothetical protein